MICAQKGTCIPERHDVLITHHHPPPTCSPPNAIRWASFLLPDGLAAARFYGIGPAPLFRHVARPAAGGELEGEQRTDASNVDNSYKNRARPRPYCEFDLCMMPVRRKTRQLRCGHSWPPNCPLDSTNHRAATDFCFSINSLSAFGEFESPYSFFGRSFGKAFAPPSLFTSSGIA